MIACDTVRRDRGCSGSFVNGATVGFALLAATFDDPENARIILLSAAGLVVLGLLIAAGTVWWWRNSGVEHPALGPLEVMGSRSWWRGDYTSRRRRLEAARPEGAEPIDPAATATSEPVDLEAAAQATPREFDDLMEVQPVAEAQPVAEDRVPEDTDAEDIDAEDIDAEDIDAEDSAAAESAPVAADEGPAVGASSDAFEPVATTEATQDDTVGVEVPRPIDPLLRLQHDE